MEKTNVMRLLDSAKIKYEIHEYGDITDGEEVAKFLALDPEMVFKTLVTVSNTNEHFVFVIPVNHTLDLKKAAKAVNVKAIEMIKQKELLPLTGYIHGGCSPIGMKKPFKTVINETALLFDTICFSAGKIGHQVELSPLDIKDYLDCNFLDIIKD